MILRFYGMVVGTNGVDQRRPKADRWKIKKSI